MDDPFSWSDVLSGLPEEGVWWFGLSSPHFWGCVWIILIIPSACFFDLAFSPALCVGGSTQVYDQGWNWGLPRDSRSRCRVSWISVLFPFPHPFLSGADLSEPSLVPFFQHLQRTDLQSCQAACGWWGRLEPRAALFGCFREVVGGQLLVALNWWNLFWLRACLPEQIIILAIFS